MFGKLYKKNPAIIIYRMGEFLKQVAVVLKQKIHWILILTFASFSVVKLKETFE